MTFHQNLDNKWEIPKQTEAKDCSFCETSKKIEFTLTPKLIAVSRKLCVDVKREWQILLIGNETEEGIFCYDYFVPKQATGLATVENNDEITLEFVKRKKIVATMHSHNEIGVSFSSTDDDCTNHSFIKNHIVTNNRHDFLAGSRVDLPCGLVKFAKAKVIMKVPEVKKIKGFDNIEEKKWGPITYYGGNGFNQNLPTHYQQGKPFETFDKEAKWSYGDARQHAFMYDQTEKGGVCGF